MQNIFSGKTVEEAVGKGLSELGIALEDAEIEVLEEGKKKLFGSIPAQVKITEKVRLTDGERAVNFLKGLFERLHADVAVDLTEEDEKIVIQLNTDETKGIIGRRGEIIDAVQILAGAVANTGRHDYKRVVVDCGNYREEREETLRHVAEKLAAKAVRIGKKVRLEPMNPYERRIIHAALVDNPDVTTKSEGTEPSRFVVIIPKNMRTYEKRDHRGGKGRFDKNDRYNKDRKNFDKKDRKPYPKRDLPSESTPQSSGTSFGRSSGGYKKGGFSGFFGTYLGNSRDEADSTKSDDTEE